MKRLSIAAFAFMVLCLARDGAAQGFINPFVGTTLSSASVDSARSKPGFGVAFGKVGKILGGESEIAYYPEVLDTAVKAKNRAIAFSGNTLIGPTIGPVKVYGAFGIGMLLLNVTSAKSLLTPNLESISNNYLAFNAGGGVMGFINKTLGVRADLRYYRAVGFDIIDIQAAGIQSVRFEFWRAGVGLAVKF